jgi:hypothetical protein
VIDFEYSQGPLEELTASSGEQIPDLFWVMPGTN